MIRFAKTTECNLRKKLWICGISAALILGFCIASLTACNSAEHYFVIGTSLEINVEGVGGAKLSESIYESIKGYGALVTPTVGGSDLYKLNNSLIGERIHCSETTMKIMRIAERAYDLSGGAYDPTVYPLVRLWKFAGDQFADNSIENAPPTDAEIKETLKSVGLKSGDGTYKAFDVDYEKSVITKLLDGAMLDFGGVAKGYLADDAKELAGPKQKVLVDLGGNIAVKNKKFNIGIGNPSREDRPLYGSSYDKVVALNSGDCISTSGDYEKYYKYTLNGVTEYFHHIINPFTGYPSDNTSLNGLVSVSVICDDGGLGDALSTAVMVLGKTKGAELIESLGLRAVFIDSSLTATSYGPAA